MVGQKAKQNRYAYFSSNFFLVSCVIVHSRDQEIAPGNGIGGNMGKGCVAFPWRQIQTLKWTYLVVGVVTLLFSTIFKKLKIF